MQQLRMGQKLHVGGKPARLTALLKDQTTEDVFLLTCGHISGAKSGTPVTLPHGSHIGSVTVIDRKQDLALATVGCCWGWMPKIDQTPIVQWRMLQPWELTSGAPVFVVRDGLGMRVRLSPRTHSGLEGYSSYRFASERTKLGDSGAPIVDKLTGAIVGVHLGSMADYGFFRSLAPEVFGRSLGFAAANPWGSA